MNTVLNGADRLELAEKHLKGMRVGVLTCASGVTKRAVPTYKIVSEKYKLTTLFAPEHGIHTNLQAGDWGKVKKDDETGADLFNLSSKGAEDIDRALSLCDVVVYDIQDVGARFYTYIYNLTYLMRECGKRNIPILILDRIDPIGGYIQGSPLCEESCSSFIGEYNIPTRYGLTVGELASYFNRTKNINCKLDIIPLSGWKREMYADETDLLWVNPSPNIPSVGCALNYIGTCIFEATNVSEGRGTTRPFDLIGSPFANSLKLYREMNALKIDGVVFRRAYFTPVSGKWAGQLCEGVELHITDRRAYDPFLTGLMLYSKFSEYKDFSSNSRSLSLRIGTNEFDSGCDTASVLKYCEKCTKYCEAFKKETESYIMYS